MQNTKMGCGYAFEIVLVRLLLIVGCLDLFLALLLFWRIPSTQQGRPNDADGQNNIQLMTNGHKIEVDKLHRYPEYPLSLSCHISEITTVKMRTK